MDAETNWLPIDRCPLQTTVLVCNDCLLGWWAVGIQCALGEWWHEGFGLSRIRLPHEPTHYQELPSIHPISLRRGKASQQ